MLPNTKKKIKKCGMMFVDDTITYLLFPVNDNKDL